jgi:hypothetical protein
MEFPDDIWRHIKKFLLFYDKNKYISFQYTRIENEKMKLASALSLHDNFLGSNNKWVRSQIKWILLKTNNMILICEDEIDLVNMIYNKITIKLLDGINFLIKRDNNMRDKEILNYYKFLEDEFLNSIKMELYLEKVENKYLDIGNKVLEQRIKINFKFYNYNIYFNKCV